MSSFFVFAFSFFLLFNLVYLLSFENGKNYDDRPPSKLSQKYSTRDIIKDNSSAIQAPEFDEETQNSSQYRFLFNPGTLEYTLKQSFGYYTLSSNIGARMSYFFFRSLRDQNDPVVIWLNGGPGLSSTVGLFYENGPFHIAPDLSLFVNNYGWNGVANILYVDQPIGTGLSFEDYPSQYRNNYHDIASDLYDLLQQFFDDIKHNHAHQFRNNDFYITGQSYAGHYAPALASMILLGNSQRHKEIKLKGIAIGNALIDIGIQYPEIPKYAFANGLITLTQQQDIERSVVPCQTATMTCMNPTQCSVAQATCAKLLDDTISQINSNRKNQYLPDINIYNIFQTLTNRPNYEYELLEAFLNDYTVKRELGIPNRQFQVYNKPVFAASTADWAVSTQGVIGDLLNRDIKFLCYVGKWDLVFNHLGTYAAVKSVIWKGQTAFLNSKKINIDDGTQTVGSKKTSGSLTYFEVLRAGNNVPADQRQLALTVIDQWMQGNF